MAASHTHNDLDLVIRNGDVVDGTGAEPFEADIAVKDGKIVGVGNVSGRGAEEIDAKGKLVTPGFVDIHTHYDGQAVWDAHSLLPLGTVSRPSSSAIAVSALRRADGPTARNSLS